MSNQKISCKEHLAKRDIILIDSKNLKWGFFGTTVLNYGLAENDVHDLFGTVSWLIAREYNISPERARCFLDSKNGRHFSDELSFHGAKTGLSRRNIFEVAKKVIETVDWVKKAAVEQELF